MESPMSFSFAQRRNMIHIKQLQKTIFPLILALILVLSTGLTALATGEGNIDGGGGGMGSGTRTDVWHSQDGVRVTVVTTSGSVVSTPFDLTNSGIPNATINFGHVCKLQYTSGASLSPGGPYTCSRPATPLPRLISGTSSKASIEAIRRYFCSEYTAQLVASKAGIAFEELISRLLQAGDRAHCLLYPRRPQLCHDCYRGRPVQPDVRGNPAQQTSQPYPPEPASFHFSGNP